MDKIYRPFYFKLKHFSISKEKYDLIESELKSMIIHMKKEQDFFFHHHYKHLIDTIIEQRVNLKSSSLNTLGRKLNIKPNNDYKNNPYNFSEMFRVNILGKALLSVQEKIIFDIYQNHKYNIEANTIKEIIKQEYSFIPVPKIKFIENIIEQSGYSLKLPKADGALPFWACDTHYCKIKDTTFKLSLHGFKGKVNLTFKNPKEERFSGKITRPTVILSNKGEIHFYFTSEIKVKDTYSLKKSEKIIGIDLGKIEQFVASVYDIEKEKFDKTIFQNRKINKVSNKIKKLYLLEKHLYHKFSLNQKYGYTNKAQILFTEYLRIRNKIKRLKRERAIYIAKQIIDVCNKHNVDSIALEYLSWTQGKSGKWEHSLIQQWIIQSAKHNVLFNKRKISVKKVNPKYSSQNCFICNQKTSDIFYRIKFCKKCNIKLNRDVLASRNIAKRFIGKNAIADIALNLNSSGKCNCNCNCNGCNCCNNSS